VIPNIVDSVIMYLGSAQENEPKSHQWSKHVLKWFYFIREIIEIKYIKIDIMIKWVPTKENLTDTLTKALFWQKHDCHIEQKSLRYMNY